jgi:hypothetical protein
MVQKTRLATLLGLGGALLMSGAAYAQPPAGYSGGSPGSMSGGSMSGGGYPGGSPSSMSGGSYPGASGSAAGTSGSGAVSNAPGSMSTSTDASSTDQSSTDSIGSNVQDSSTLARTGGEPWMMALAGATLAIGALSLRRRIN